ncbi:MAG TPA: hypothetical protein VN608_05550 [Clostridia bacterium]|nr:hypothetical protein [Clostridia bacterium]
MGKKDEQNINKIIEKAVQQAFEAGRQLATQNSKDVYKATERRLFALPILRAKLIEEQDDLSRLLEEQAPDIVVCSKDIVRFRRSGMRLSDDELFEAQITDLRGRIAAKTYEICEMERALKEIEHDAYHAAVIGRYIENMSDEVIGEKLHCDSSTVRRNRSRLVRKIAIWLYGPEAI